VLARPRIVIAVCLAFAVVAGYFVAGHFFYEIPIGLDASAFPAGEAIYAAIRTVAPGAHGSTVGFVWFAASLLAIAAAVLLTVRASLRAEARATDVARRRFLGAWVAAIGALLAGAAAATARAIFGVGQGGRGWMAISQSIQAPVVRTHPEWMERWKGSRVKAYRRLGRTGWEVSDIVLGTGQIRGENGQKIAELALERGVNYFDTSPDYSGAGSEQAMGGALRSVRRDQVFVATKFCTPRGHLPPGTPVARYKAAVEESLGRLRTDYVDLCHIHSCDEVPRLLDPNVHEAFAQLKQEGKVRFLGFSTHTPNLVEVAETGIDDGRFDVMMLAYHFGQWAPLGDIIARGRREQDMGVVAMKTLKGAKHNGLAGFREHADAFSQAALTWTLSNPDVSCAVISFFELQHVDEYLYASGRELAPRDVAILEEYDRQVRGTYCEPHCGACLDSCPEGLRIPDVLRHRMYFEDYGWQKEAMRLYAGLEKQASVCVGCSAPCARSCPVGIPIRERTLGAHGLLTLA
jgi:predicted aldo/keto reductase-like oxidoreductase